MAQFDVYRNADPETRRWAPYLVVLQDDLLSDLDTVVVAPLVDAEHFGRPITRLNPLFDVATRRYILSVPELAGISKHDLTEKVTTLLPERDAIIAALDLLFTGI